MNLLLPITFGLPIILCAIKNHFTNHIEGMRAGGVFFYTIKQMCMYLVFLFLMFIKYISTQRSNWGGWGKNSDPVSTPPDPSLYIYQLGAPPSSKTETLELYLTSPSYLFRHQILWIFLPEYFSNMLLHTRSFHPILPSEINATVLSGRKPQEPVLCWEDT